MSTTVTVSEKGQVTLPKALRDRLGIKAGSQLEARLASDGTLQLQLLETGSASLSGLLARPRERARSLQEMDAAVTLAVKDRSRRSR
jgi:AbrB family looped-hinge helix DNA binding protein